MFAIYCVTLHDWKGRNSSRIALISGWLVSERCTKSGWFALIQENSNRTTSFLENSADNQALNFRFFHAIFRHIFNYYKIKNLLKLIDVLWKIDANKTLARFSGTHSTPSWDKPVKISETYDYCRNVLL